MRHGALLAMALSLGPAAAAAGDDGERASYLSGTCTACHRGSDPTAPIPGLAGRSPEDFLAAMRDFKSGARASQIMAAVATTLSDEELALLARHFSEAAEVGR